MALNVATTIDAQAAMIRLSGELDARTAPLFQRAVEQAATQPVTRLVLLMAELEYISSAGLGVLLRAVHTMPGVELYVSGAQPQVQDTLQLSGVDRVVMMGETYDAARP